MFFIKCMIFGTLALVVNARPDVSELKKVNSLIAVGPGFNSESSAPQEPPKAQSLPTLGASVNFQVPPTNEYINTITNLIESAPQNAIINNAVPIQLDPDVFRRVQYTLEKLDSSKLYFPNPLSAVRSYELPVPDETEFLKLTQSFKGGSSVESKPKYLPPEDDGYKY